MKKPTTLPMPIAADAMKIRRRSSVRCSTRVMTFSRRRAVLARVCSHDRHRACARIPGPRSRCQSAGCAVLAGVGRSVSRRSDRPCRRQRLGLRRASTLSDSWTSVEALRNSRIVLPSALPTSGSLPGPRIEQRDDQDEQQLERADVERHGRILALEHVWPSPRAACEIASLGIGQIRAAAAAMPRDTLTSSPPPRSLRRGRPAVTGPLCEHGVDVAALRADARARGTAGPAQPHGSRPAPPGAVAPTTRPT